MAGESMRRAAEEGEQARDAGQEHRCPNQSSPHLVHSRARRAGVREQKSDSGHYGHTCREGQGDCVVAMDVVDQGCCGRLGWCEAGVAASVIMELLTTRL